MLDSVLKRLRLRGLFCFLVKQQMTNFIVVTVTDAKDGFCGQSCTEQFFAMPEKKLFISEQNCVNTYTLSVY